MRRATETLLGTGGRHRSARVVEIDASPGFARHFVKEGIDLGAMTFLFLLAVAQQSPTPGRAATSPPNREDVRAALARWWEAVDTIEVDYDRLTPSEDDDVQVVYQQYHLAKAPGGKYSTRAEHLLPDGGVKVIMNERTDGRRVYQVMTVPGSPDVTDYVNIMYSKSATDLYKGPMSDLLWIIMPGGRPLHKRLDNGAEFAIEPNESGEDDTYTIRFDDSGNGLSPVRCELDPRHDWLPRRVSLGEPPMYSVKVERYTRDHGIEFPAEGEVTLLNRSNARVSYRFLVRRLSLNEPVSDDQFGVPGVVTGTLLMDQTKRQNSVEGGSGARQAFMAKYRPELPSVGPPPSPIVAERAPRTSWVPTVLIIGSAVILGSLLYIRLRDLKTRAA